MVLNELGSKITAALRRMTNTTVIDEQVFDELLKDVSRALLEADVNVRIVANLRNNVKKRVNIEEMGAGVNKRKVIQKAVFDELVEMLDPGEPDIELDDGSAVEEVEKSGKDKKDKDKKSKDKDKGEKQSEKEKEKEKDKGSSKSKSGAKKSFHAATSSGKLRKGKTNVVMFVGLQGNGKTTTCTKFAYYHQRRGWKTCLVCADTFRAGAFDQLKQNATKARIPFYGSYTETDPVKIATEGVERFKADNYELIIVDTSGRHKQEVALFDEMEQMAKAIKPCDIIFVMDSSIGQAAYDQALAFKKRVKIGSVIITKLDGHAKGGGALSAVSATESPITFIGTGEHIDDLEPFNPVSFVQRLLGMGDVGGLVTSIKEAGLDQDPELYKRVMEGHFSLRDMYDQFQNISKLGPLNKVMGMIPGISEMVPAGKEEEGAARMKKFCNIMDSMTDEELDNEKISFTPSRIMRIARGAGCNPRLVEELLVEYKRFSKVIEKMGKMKGLKNAANMDPMAMSRTMPSQLAGQLSKVMDPRMLRQMGGNANITQMLKQLQGMGLGGPGKGGFPGL